MKLLDVTPISDTSRFPVKKGTWQFLQDAHKEDLAALIRALIGSGYDPAVVYVLWGCTNSATVPSYTIAAGAVFFNGEVFAVDATSFTATGGNVAVFAIAQTQYTVDADPVTFTDGTIRNVHNIRKMGVVQGATGSTIADYTQAFFLSFVIPEAANLEAPTTGPYAGNIIQIIGAYPDLVLFAPTPPTNTYPVLASGSLNIGDVNPNVISRTVTFDTPLATDQYFVVGTIISNFGGGPGPDLVVTWGIRSRATTGFVVCFREYAAEDQNIAWEWLAIKKP